MEPITKYMKPIDGFPGSYITPSGAVYSDRLGKLILRKPHVENGFLRVGLRNKDGETKTKSVHILVADAFLGKHKPGERLIQMDGDKTNPDITNLKYTQIQKKPRPPRQKHDKTGRSVIVCEKDTGAVIFSGTMSEVSAYMHLELVSLYNHCAGRTQLKKIPQNIEIRYATVYPQSIPDGGTNKAASHSKPVLMFDATGRFECRYPSAAYAAREQHTADSNITYACRNKNHQWGSHFFWYEEAYDEMLREELEKENKDETK